jgi:hypothetical protein
MRPGPDDIGGGLAASSFMAYRAAALSLATGEVITYDSKEWDPDGCFNTSTGAFRASRAGVYRLSACALQTGLADQQFFGLRIYKNGAAHRYLGRGTESGQSVAAVGSGSTLVRAAQGDYFQVVVQHNHATAPGTLALSVGSEFCWFSGEYVGRAS